MGAGEDAGSAVDECVEECEVDAAAAGSRLDLFLTRRLEISRAQARRLLAGGGVSVDGRRQGLADKGRILAGGARVAIARYRPPEAWAIAPEPAGSPLHEALGVLAEGPGWLALDKPAGRPVHPLDEGETGTVLNAVAARWPEVRGVGEAGLRSGVVHRLDVDTSGVLLVATGQAAWERLRTAFRRHRVAKTYLALAHGRIEHPRHCRVGLVVARHRPAVVRVVDAEAAGARRGVRVGVLDVRPLEALRDATLVEVGLETGFLHQIRATLAHLGHPLLGDAHYGSGASADAAPRQMLHAQRVRFEEIAAESPLPADFAACLEERRRTPDASGC